jgi:PhnB protein
MNTSHIPAGYQSVTPSLTIRGAAKALEFYKKAFGAEEMYRLPGPGDKIMHAEFKIGNSTMMMSDEAPEWKALSPQAIGGCPSSFLIYVPDVDAAMEKAVKAGATPFMPVADQFWGDRMGALTDPFGYRWSLATRKETLSEEEIQKRFKVWMEKNNGKGCG